MQKKYQRRHGRSLLFPNMSRKRRKQILSAINLSVFLAGMVLFSMAFGERLWQGPLKANKPVPTWEDILSADVPPGEGAGMADVPSDDSGQSQGMAETPAQGTSHGPMAEPDAGDGTKPVIPAEPTVTEEPIIPAEPTATEEPIIPAEPTPPEPTSTPRVRATPRPAAQARASQGITVHIPKSGSRYHANPTCGNMKESTAIPIEAAKEQGYTACQRCKPPE